MIPLRDDQVVRARPIVSWTLIALNVLIYFWDRRWNLFGGQMVFPDLALRPAEVVAAVQGSGDRFPIVTLFTAMFLHGGLMHLLGNLIFLGVFAPGIEQALGSPRFALYYFFWGIAASATHVLVNPLSFAPMVGASGAIGGVLGAYFLLFPANKIEIIVPIFPFVSVVVSAWVLLGLWFLWQILVPQAGVANWAHAGGFLAGMLTVLIMGGRAAVLTRRSEEFDPIADV